VIPLDKQLHFFSGGMLAGMLMPFGFEWAWFGCLVAAVGKEIYDGMGYGNQELADALATLAGGSIVVIWTVIWTTQI